MRSRVHWRLHGGSAFRCQFAYRRFHQERTIWEENGWDTTHASIHLLNIRGGPLILFDIDRLIGNPVLVEPAFCHATVATKGGAIQFDGCWLPWRKTLLVLHDVLLQPFHTSLPI